MTNRERFEAWAKEQGLETVTMIDGDYYFGTTSAAWAAWQAACPDGWQCAPIEPTDEMEEAALDAYTPFGDMKLAILAAVIHAPKPEDVE